jgi:ribosomal protein S6
VNIEFEAPGTALAVLERAFQLDEMILRYLTIVLDPKAIAARAALVAPAAQPEPAPAPAPAREPLFTETPEDKK